MKKTYNIILEKQLWKKLKEYAKHQNRDLSELIETVLTEYVREYEERVRQHFI